jgi:predicted dehydrogenase
VAETFGIAHAFEHPEDLIACPEVDVVAITVKAPDHAPLVRSALAAGKHVFCEWPLGVDAAEADELASVASRSSVAHLVGLQAYHSPGAVFVRSLVDSGVIGEVTGVSMAALTPGLGAPEVAPSMTYTLDPRNGATLLTVYAAHALSALSRCVGDLVDVDASSTVRHDTVAVTGTDQRLPNAGPNEVALTGRLRSGALATLAVHGGTPPGVPRLSLRIIGTAGALLVHIDEVGTAVNVGEWQIRLAARDGSLETVEVPAHPAVVPGMPIPARNVAVMYNAFAQAVAEGAAVQPDFHMAARFQHTIETIGLAARTGQRQALAPYTEV